MSQASHREELWMKEMCKKHEMAQQIQKFLVGKKVRGNTKSIQDNHTLEWDCINDMLWDNYEKLQELNKMKSKKNMTFENRFKHCERSSLCLDFGEKNIYDMLNDCVFHGVLRKRDGELYKDHWCKQKSKYNTFLSSYKKEIRADVNNELDKNKIYICELVPKIYNLYTSEEYIKAYGTWVKGDTNRKDGKTITSVKRLNCPKQILAWIMMIVICITENYNI